VCISSAAFGFAAAGDGLSGKLRIGGALTFPLVVGVRLLPKVADQVSDVTFSVIFMLTEDDGYSEMTMS
jgi:hypothetical protein